MKPKTYVHFGRWTKHHELRPICGVDEDALMTHGQIPILTDCPDCLAVLKDELNKKYGGQKNG